jgi:pyruvate dehydrogenase (quinone)/pyruvate oxidase
LQFHDLISTSTQQDVELDKLFMDACVYDTRIMGAAHVENVVNLACHTAIAKSGVAHVTMPVDIQSLPTKKDARSARNVPHHTSRAAAKIIAPPRAQDLRAAADILNAGTKICILAGRGALGARRELRELAARLKAPVAKALLGKGAMADTDPLCTGGVGLLGTKPSQDALTSCDTLLIVGSSFRYIEFYPKPDQARAVQIDTDPARIGLRYPVACGIVADAADALASLLPLVDERRETGFLDTAQGAMKAWRDSLAEQGQSRDQPMKPQVVAYELNRVLPDNAIVATDSGTNTTWCARYLDMRDDMMFSVSGNLASRLADCPMRMPPRSHSPIARWWPLSATAASAC